MTERTVTRTFGAQSLVAPLREALVKRPGPAFGLAFDDPAHGFLHAVDLSRAQAEHDALTATLRELGVTIHELGIETADPDLCYTFDASLITDRGAILLRSGKANRPGRWTAAIRSGSTARPSASAGRCAPTAAVQPSWRSWWAGTCACSTCPSGRGRRRRS